MPTPTPNELFNSELRALLTLRAGLVCRAGHIPDDIHSHNHAVETFAQTFIAFHHKHKPKSANLSLLPETLSLISPELLLNSVMNSLFSESRSVLRDLEIEKR